METATEPGRSINPSNGTSEFEDDKPLVVVIMGPTAAGKSRLAIDLAATFPIEIINADSMQVYKGLDVITNKVPLEEQKGVPHHLLGTVNPNKEFTAKMFRDSAIALINDIWSRNHLPVIVGGTNYYIQALVSPFLLDDSLTSADDNLLVLPPGEDHSDSGTNLEEGDHDFSFEYLKEIDPVAASRIHPNNQRKINQYISLYTRSGVLPSKFFQESIVEVCVILNEATFDIPTISNLHRYYIFDSAHVNSVTLIKVSELETSICAIHLAGQNWGRAENFRYHCCFICVDASLPVLDRYVEDRVNVMVNSGLLGEVCDIYNVDAVYTRGLRQAIGVREFETFLQTYISKLGYGEADSSCGGSTSLEMPNEVGEMLKENMKVILSSSIDNELKILLEEAIDNVKANTRRLVRRQRRRIHKLQTLFGWNVYFVDSTEAISFRSNDSWDVHVVEPAVNYIKHFQDEHMRRVENSRSNFPSESNFSKRDLWTQYVCKACGDRVLRGAHEWEEHRKGRSHRKRSTRMKKLNAAMESSEFESPSS